MPIYEYRCEDCQEESSIFFKSFSAAETTTPECEHCGSVKLSKLISSPGRPRVKGGTGDGELRAVSGKKAVENMSRQYDRSGVDPGGAFADIAGEAAKGASPQELKQAVKEAKSNMKKKD